MAATEPARRQITSARNPLLRHLRALRGRRGDRREAGEFLCEGWKLLGEALQNGAELTALATVPEADLPPLPDGLPVYEVPVSLLDAVSPSDTPQGVLFTCRIPDRPLPDRLPAGRYLVLDGLQDPGNVGTILRTGDALGLTAALLLPGCADPYGPKAVRASMGAVFRLPFYEADLTDLTALLERSSLPLWAADVGPDAVDIRAADLRRAAVAIGSEGQGLSPALLAQCTGRITIPMRQRCESLNAAVAAALILWEMGR